MGEMTGTLSDITVGEIAAYEAGLAVRESELAEAQAALRELAHALIGVLNDDSSDAWEAAASALDIPAVKKARLG